MPEAAHIRACRTLIRHLQKKTYFPVALPVYERILAELTAAQLAAGCSESDAEKAAARQILSRLHDVMRAAQPLVEGEITARKAAGRIVDANQARKNAAGNVFQQMLAYSIARNILLGNITKPVAVTMSVKSLIGQYAAIQVGEDTLTPDSDVIVYAPENETSPVMNFSCKTSCRERIGQTYKWKLMCDLATCTCAHKAGNPDCPATRYNLIYTPTRQILTCLATADFYDELRNPQISASFHFFDYSYIAKTTSPSAAVRTLETVVDDIHHVF